ncbi:MAG: hypothetical protein ABIE07_10595 [Candidatus Zixiibacteriota bacterium]
MHSKIMKVFICLLGAGFFIFSACSEDKTTEPPPPTVVTDMDSVMVSFGAMMQTMFDSMEYADNPQLDDFDFSQMHQIFVNYENLNPGDPQASFGAAITSMLSITQSQDLNDLIDTIIAMDGSGMFLKRHIPLPNKVSGTGALIGFPTSFESSGVEKNFLAQTNLALASLAISNPPKFSEIQAIIRNDLMPAITNATTYMDNVLDVPNYIFWVTPEMTGETSDSIEVDRADFLTFAAGLRVIKSFFHMAIAYDIDLPSYDGAGLAYMFDQSNDWMSLANDGATQMSSAKTGFLEAITFVDNALTALAAELISDPDQSNELIVTDWSAYEFMEAHAIIDSVQFYMGGAQWVVADFDGDDLVDSIQVNAANLFDNPIDGFFSLLPPYSAEISDYIDTSWYCYNYWDGYQWQYECFIDYIDTCYMTTITWDADTYEEWVFPNPSINGIFPGITSDADLKELLGIDPLYWDKTISFDMCIFN